MLKSLVRWMILVLLLLALPFAGLAQDDENIYEDPAGFFTFPIPTNWQVEETDDYVLVTNPENNLLIYFMVRVGDEDLEGALADAWALVEPDFDLEVRDVTTITDPALLEGMDQMTVITYDTPPTEVVQGLAQTYQGITYLGLFRLEIVPLQLRAAQFQQIVSGFTVTALEQEDLTGVEPLPITDEMLAEYEEFIVTMLELGEIPGAAVAVVQGDEVIYANGFGVTELGTDTPVTAETQMMIGSTTKTFTTMLMATLVDDDIMEWDTRVIDILPTFEVANPDVTQEITVRNLVCACSGVPRRDFELVFNYEDLAAEDIVEELATYQFFTDFGEAFQYSNQMVAMGGYAAALAAGVEYGQLYEGYVDLVQERILDPIGMDATTFSFDAVQAAGNYAMPHGVNLDNEYYPIPLRYEEFATPVAPAGALWSNVLDMAQYMITALNVGVAPDGTRVVSEENLRETWQPQIRIDANNQYGLGWILTDYKGLQFISHGGNMLGYTSEMAFLPEADLGIVILTNARVANLINDAISTRLIELVYDEEPQIENQVRAIIRMVEEQDDTTFGELDVEAVTPYLGRWMNPALGEIVLEVEENSLFLDAGEFRMELRPLLDDDGELRYYVSYEMPLAGVDAYLTEDDDGNPLFVYGSGVVEYTFIPGE